MSIVDKIILILMATLYLNKIAWGALIGEFEYG